MTLCIAVLPSIELSSRSRGAFHLLLKQLQTNTTRIVALKIIIVTTQVAQIAQHVPSLHIGSRLLLPQAQRYQLLYKPLLLVWAISFLKSVSDSYKDTLSKSIWLITWCYHWTTLKYLKNIMLSCKCHCTISTKESNTVFKGLRVTCI